MLSPVWCFLSLSVRLFCVVVVVVVVVIVVLGVFVCPFSSWVLFCLVCFLVGCFFVLLGVCVSVGRLFVGVFVVGCCPCLVFGCWLFSVCWVFVCVGCFCCRVFLLSGDLSVGCFLLVGCIYWSGAFFFSRVHPQARKDIPQAHGDIPQTRGDIPHGRGTDSTSSCACSQRSMIAPVLRALPAVTKVDG